MTQEQSTKSHGMLFFVMMLSTILGSLMQTALSTLLPSIMSDFAIGADTAQWLNTVYSLVMGVMIPATAYLLRRFPTRPLYLTSLLVLLGGLVLSSFAHSFPIMLIGRILQAISAGMSTSMLQVVILTIFPREKRGTMMGVYGIAMSAAPAFAPTLAGMVADAFGWRMFFYGALVLYAVNILLALRFMQSVLEVERQNFDLLSFVMCGAGLTLITLGLGDLDALVKAVVFLLVGCAFMTLFVLRQTRREQPFLNVRVLLDNRCRMGVLLSMLLYAGLIAASTLTPMYQQMCLGMSATQSGLILMPGSLSTALISPLTGKLYDKYGIRALALVGSLLSLASSIGYCLTGVGTPVALLVILFILRNIAVACLLMPLVTWGRSHLPAINTSDGTAILTTLRTIAGAIGSALFVSLMTKVSGANGVSINGMHAAFAGLAAVATVQLFVCLIWVRDKRETTMAKGGNKQ